MKTGFLATTALASLILVLAPSSIMAQTGPAAATPEDEANTANDGIVVTARRREESIQDVPFAIEAISADQIESRGITNVEDIAKYTPGLVFDRGISLQDTRPVIRGLPATRGRPPVGVLLNGIDISTESLGNAGGGSLLNSRLLDLERIEVVKGPQSALYGRAAFAGAINYITKRPTKSFEGQVRGSYANFDTYELGGSLSGPISDQLGFRVSGNHAQSDGDYKNPISRQNLNAFKNTGGSVGLEVDTASGFNAYLRVAYAEYENSQPALQSLSGFIPGNVSRPGPDTIEGRAVRAGITGGALAATALPSNVPPRQTLRFTGVTGLSLDPRTGKDFPGLNGDTLTATLNVSADLGPFEFVYNGGYVSQNERLVYDGDFFGRAPEVFADGAAEPLNIIDLVDFSNDLTLISQEVRFQDFSPGPFRWAVGGLYWYSDVQQESRSIRAISGFPLTGRPTSAARSADALFRASSLNLRPSPFRRKTNSLSVYGLAEYDVFEALTVSAEARYISEKSQVVRSDFVQAAFAPISATFVNPVQRASIKDDAVVPRFSVTYKPSDAILFYASAAKGFKPAGISELDFGSLLVDSQFDSESVWNYEVGAKTSFADGQVTLNGALFYMDWTDKQVSQLIEDPAAPSGFRASVRNAGAAKVLGVDASIVFRPRFARGLTWDIGYTFLDTEYTDFTVLANSAFTVTEGGNCTVVTVGTRPVCQVTYNGNRLERAPKHQLVTNLAYSAKVSENVELTIGGSLQYQGSRFLTEDNRLRLPSFINVDMQVGLEFSTFKIEAFVQNLTKESAVRTAQNNFDLSTFGRSVNIYAPPLRAFGVRGSVTF